MDKLSLGDRMKENYEKIFCTKLPLRLPVLIRLDIKSAHTLTRGMEKPFDQVFMDAMNETALYCCKNIQGAQLAYVQSDEISILLHNYKKFESQPWFGNEIQKMVSISAAFASSFMSLKLNTLIQFDSRVFVLPENEVCNCLIWRQQDWERNSIQMLAQSLYSHNELHQKNNSDMQEMCWQKGKNWNDLSISLKRGRCVRKDGEGKWYVDLEIPIFSKSREYIEELLKVEEE